MKNFSIGYSISGLYFEIDETTLSAQSITTGDTFYVGYTGNKGKFAIYITLNDIIEGENGQADTAVVNVLINDYATSDKFKEYTLKLKTEWHNFDELN